MKIFNSFNALVAAQNGGQLCSQMSSFNNALENMSATDGAEIERLKNEIKALKEEIRTFQRKQPLSESECIQMEHEVEKRQKEINLREKEIMQIDSRGDNAIDKALYPDTPDENPIASAKPPTDSLHVPNIPKRKDDDDGSWMPPSTKNQEE